MHIEKIIGCVWILFCNPHAFSWLPTSTHECFHIPCTLSNDIPKVHLLLPPNFILLKFPLTLKSANSLPRVPFQFSLLEFLSLVLTGIFDSIFWKKSVKGAASSHHWYIHKHCITTMPVRFFIWFLKISEF